MKSDLPAKDRGEWLATDNTRINKNIFNLGQQYLFVSGNSAAMIKHHSFNVLPAAVPVWTPPAQNCINLTAVQVSAPLGVTVILSNTNDAGFMSLRLTDQATTVSQSFSSAYRLKRGDAIRLRTSDETTSCENSGAASAAQVAYNGRSDFTGVANAAGMPDGQYAVLTSAVLLGGTRGRIVLSYNMLPAAMSQLQIESVVIKFYCRLSLAVQLGTSSMIFYWRPNSAADWIELQQASLSLLGTIDYLTNPLVLDITAAVLAAPDPWAVVGNLQTSFVGIHTGLVGLSNRIELDAVVVEICVIGINKITLIGFES